jgi:hypothetical protein
LRAEARSVEALVERAELVDRALPAAEDLDERVARVHLLDMAIEISGLGPLRHELLLRATSDDHGDEERQRHGEDRNDREERTDPQHHRERADHREHRRHELVQALLERRSDVVDVIGDAAQDVAVRMAVEVAQWKARELLLHLAP